MQPAFGDLHSPQPLMRALRPTRDRAMEPKQIVQAWVEAFNKSDVELITSFYSEDAINHQVANEPVVGIEAIRSMFKEDFSSAEMVCIVEHIFQDGEWSILEWKDPLGLRGCGFFQIKAGKIVFQRGYWDKLSFLKQHGLPIPHD
jgi:limonene-1,2-epoxide hydrolase